MASTNVNVAGCRQSPTSPSRRAFAARRHPNPSRRRALELLAHCPQEGAKAVMLAWDQHRSDGQSRARRARHGDGAACHRWRAQEGSRNVEDDGSGLPDVWSIVVSIADDPYAERKKLTFEQAEGAGLC